LLYQQHACKGDTAHCRRYSRALPKVTFKEISGPDSQRGGRPIEHDRATPENEGRAEGHEQPGQNSHPASPNPSAPREECDKSQGHETDIPSTRKAIASMK
jgi:hypothetical protein